MKMSDHFHLPLPQCVFVLGRSGQQYRKAPFAKADSAACHAINLHDDMASFIRSLVDDSQLELGFREQAEALLQRADSTP